MRNFVIVAETQIQLAEGFTAFTGETGAGKSLLIDALGLLSGERADPKMVRQGAKRAELAAAFAILPDHPVHASLLAADLEGDDGELLLRRTLEADGRSKAYINGHPATMQQLRDIANQLISTHGQQASQTLTSSDAARICLDRYGQHSRLLESYREAYEHSQSTQDRYRQACDLKTQGQARFEQLQWMLETLEEVAPRVNEWQEIQTEHHRLSHGEKLKEAIHRALEQCADDEDAMLSKLHRIVGKMQHMLEFDPALQASVDLLDGARIQLDEAAQQLRRDLDRTEADPARFAQLEARMSLLHQTARKLRIPPEALAEQQAQYQHERLQLEQLSDLNALAQEAEIARAALEAKGLELRKQREQTGKAFESAVNALLPALGMPKARLNLQFEALEPQSYGMDRLSFLWQAHAGGQARPLAKSASGGELSRIALAISTAAAQSNPTPTLIFDEADAGVGGAVGQAIGELMRTLGGSRQVLCVTHLAQVASQAHHQLKVIKREDKGLAYSEVLSLDSADRIEEIARMLGGRDITDTTRRAAHEMLQR